MKGKIILWIFCMLLALGVTYNYVQNNKSEKIAFVKSADILNGFVVMKSAREQYQLQVKGYQSRIDTLSINLQNGIKEHEKGISSMSKNEKALSEELLRTKQQQLVDYQKAMQQKANQEDQQMTQGVLKQINAFLENYGKEHGYKIIFGATEVGNIVYAEDALDITKPVLEELNIKYAQ